MSTYADAHLANSEPDDYGDKECPSCNGMGETEDNEICDTCEGSGTVPKDVDDATSDEWDFKCED